MSSPRLTPPFHEIHPVQARQAAPAHADPPAKERIRTFFPVAYAALLASLLCLALWISCSENVYTGDLKQNKPPEIRLTNGPLEGDTTSYHVHFYWIGNDADGTVAFYEYVLVSGDPIGFDPADTTGPDKWTRTVVTDRLFKVTADEYDSTINIKNNLYAKFSKTHTFFIRAVDDRGARSSAAHCSFTAFTIAPYIFIESPRNPNPGFGQVLCPRVTFEWYGKDPINSPWNTQEVDSIRYLLVEYTPYVIDELNKNPEKYEHQWLPWIAYNAPGDSGRSTILGDDEILGINKNYIFAVQAKDEAGAVSSIFDLYTNARKFLVVQPVGPVLMVRGRNIGTYKFIGTKFLPLQFDLPEGFPLIFSWEGNASDYGGIISTYRYGWDIMDLNEPEEWDVTPSPYIKAAPPKKYFTGSHTLYIEAVDDIGAVTLAMVQCNIFPITMDRNLLLVDDFNSSNFTQTLYAMPTEYEHDNFWVDVCSRAEGFDPYRDIWDTKENFWLPPDQQTLWHYKNVIWIHSAEDRTPDDEGTAWIKLCQFVPESWIGRFDQKFNYLQTFMSYGGHVWTLGKADREGGLGGLLQPISRAFPRHLKCETTYTQTGCAGDTSGVYSMPYQDYCVTVLDKLWGFIRPHDPRQPEKDVDIDAMIFGLEDESDMVTAEHPRLPDTLQLWEEVTRPGRFFDPQVRGFVYVELYNPEYWMQIVSASSQGCFHPMYRMRTRNTNSHLNNTVVAFWTTKYASVNTGLPGCVFAPSVHFGFPLWFFNRREVNALADEIFRTWHISAYQ